MLSSTTNVPGWSDSLLANNFQFFPISADQGPLYEDIVKQVHRDLKPLMQGRSEWLEQDVLEFGGGLPVRGDVAEVWVGTMGNRKVAIKSYRLCSTCPDYAPAYMRFCAEALGCSGLKGPHIVPFIGVYSAPGHPMALVFEFMDHKDLGAYLEKTEGPGNERELLLEIARGVRRMHKLDVAHGNLKATNVLVDAHGHASVAGLSVAFHPSDVPRKDPNWYFRGLAPELIDPLSPRSGDPPLLPTTKDSDMYAFGVLVWDVFAWRTPFSGMEIAGITLMMNEDHRSSHPVHHHVSNRIWEMIKGCWDSDLSQRPTITEVIAILEAELDHQ